MEELEIAVPTDRRRLSELRGPLDEALAEILPTGLFESRWEAETLHLVAPGTDATLTLEEGRLIGRARLRPPASLMRSRIESTMTEMLRRIAAVGAAE